MNQDYISEELKKHLKKGELFRNDLDKDLINSDLELIEKNILEENFEFNIKTNGNYFFIESIAEKLVIRKLNDNIKRIYKDEQANRKFIIHQVKTLLKETAPFWIIKTDIKSFYENIDRDRIFRKMKNDAMLSYYSIHLLKKIFDNQLVSSQSGLPRGLNISSILSEIYMRNFDKVIQRFQDVYYYARFVDDIIIFLNNRKSAITLFDKLNETLKEQKLTLTINNEKTQLIDGLNFKVIQHKYKSPPKHNNLEYLGYKFFLNEIDSDRKLNITIADKKVKKIKTRIVKSYVDFLSNNDFELLKLRVLFITGNYGISESYDGSTLKAGIYYNYSHINDQKVLNDLNIFHRKLLYSKKDSLGINLNRKITNSQRNILNKYCFISGYNNKTFNLFNFVTMGKIIKCW